MVDKADVTQVKQCPKCKAELKIRYIAGNRYLQCMVCRYTKEDFVTIEERKDWGV